MNRIISLLKYNSKTITCDQHNLKEFILHYIYFFRYAYHVNPLITVDEFTVTQKNIELFLTEEGGGPKLQRELLELDKQSPTSWLEGWWDTMYRELRCPTPINVNPFFVIEDHPADMTQVCKYFKFIILFIIQLLFIEWQSSWINFCCCKMGVFIKERRHRTRYGENNTIMCISI